MGWIVKRDRKKGRYRVWSTIADGYMFTDATREEVVSLYADEAVEESARRVNAELDALNWEKKPR